MTPLKVVSSLKAALPSSIAFSNLHHYQDCITSLLGSAVPKNMEQIANYTKNV